MSVLVAGIGCSSAATAQEIIALVEATLFECARHPADLACLATIDPRAAHPALVATARHFRIPLRCFSIVDLMGRGEVVSPSETVHARVGLSGVAEAVALHAGPLLVTKRKSAHATCALSEAAEGFEPQRFGSAARSAEP